MIAPDCLGGDSGGRREEGTGLNPSSVLLLEETELFESLDRLSGRVDRNFQTLRNVLEVGFEASGFRQLKNREVKPVGNHLEGFEIHLSVFGGGGYFREPLL